MLATTSRFRLPAFISAVLALLMMLGFIPATAADTATASIQGTVTAPAGVTPAGTQVYAFTTAFQSQIGQSSVGADGSYKMTNLPAGSYKLQFTGWNTGAQDQWYKNAASYDTATAVTVAAGQALTGINATLVKGATIGGKVTIPAGVSAANLSVVALSTPSRRQSGMSPVGLDGSYKVTGLPAGSYKVQFSGWNTGVLDQWYNNAASFDTATAVTVTTGQAVTGINATLVRAATISGKVTAPVGVTLANVRVSASPTSSQNSVGLSSAVAPDGSYKITGLPAGSYKVQFSGWNTGAADQWYTNAASFEAATAVTVAAGQDLTGINSTLVKAATISGKVTAPAGVDLSNTYVSASPSASYGSPMTRSASIAPDGSYKIMGLSASSYKLQFSGWNTGALDQWYKNAASFAAATAVTVAAGQDLSGINATLVRGATISGKVTVPAGTTVSNIRVSTWLSSSMTPVGQTINLAPDGSYKIIGLPAGSYRLQFSGYETGAVDQWYKNASSFDTAAAVTVAAGQDLAGIDTTLAKAATISGKITAPAGVELTKVVAPGVTVAATTVHVYSAGSSKAAVAHGYVNPDGTYRVSGLAAGSYKFLVSGWNTGAADQWFDKAVSFQTARTLTVTTGQNLTGINPVLLKGSTVSGKITGGGTAGTPVSVLNSAGTVVRDGYAGADGTYSIGGLAAGSYKVAFNRASGSSLAEAQFYNNKPESAGVSAAQTVAVGTGTSVPNINATLVTGGSIAGVLTDKAAKPLANSRVYAYSRDGSLITRSGSTGADGKFTVAGLSTGAYLVTAQSSDGSKIYSGNVAIEANAKPITVTVGKTTNMGTLSFGTAPLALTAAPVPTVTGTTVSGQKLTAVPGTWGPAPVALAYQWKRAGVNITGATAATYVLTSSDVGKTITVTVKGSKTGYTTASKTSAATKVVTAPLALTAAPVPTVTGTTVSGQRLTAVPGTWGPAPVALAYRWKRAGVNITGATAATYVLTSSDVGKTITVTVTGSKTGYVTTAKTSAITKVVTAG